MSNSTDQPGLKPLRLSDDFTPPSYEEWRKVVESQLKGVPFEKAMITPTYEGIDLQPIYRKEDVANLPHNDSMPGFDSFIRGTDPLGYVVKSWDVAQQQQADEPAKVNKVLRQELMRGLNRIALRVSSSDLRFKNEDLRLGREEQNGAEQNRLKSVVLQNIEDMEALLDGIELSAVAIDFKVDGDTLEIAQLLHEWCHRHQVDLHEVQGSICVDLRFKIEELRFNRQEQSGEEATSFLNWMKKHAPKMKAIAIDTEYYHNNGASAVEELAAAMGTAVETIEELKIGVGATGMVAPEQTPDIDDIAQRIRFEFCVGSNFFMEIAKLRAARYMWANIVKAFGGNTDSQKITMHSKTSQYNKTIFDPYVNILRSTTEAFAAILGGIDSLHVDAFDSVIRESDEFSRHIARNQQLILKEETHLDALVDPAGGSWYIETLTEQLAQKAWALFQEIEGLGGMSKAHDFIMEKIKAVAALREKNLRTRKDVMVGTNMFANPGEVPLTLGGKSDVPPTSGGKSGEEPHKISGTSLPAEVSGTRLAAPYEKMRLAVERHIQKTGKRPTIFLATMGTIAQYKARAEFAQGFFSAAGFSVIEEEGFQATEVACTHAMDSKAEAVCICATDDMYPTLVPELVKELRNAKPGIPVILAGYPTDMVETYKAQGIDDFIYLRADVVETLTRILKKVGVAI